MLVDRSIGKANADVTGAGVPCEAAVSSPSRSGNDPPDRLRFGVPPVTFRQVTRGSPGGNGAGLRVGAKARNQALSVATERLVKWL